MQKIISLIFFSMFYSVLSMVSYADNLQDFQNCSSYDAEEDLKSCSSCEAEEDPLVLSYSKPLETLRRAFNSIPNRDELMADVFFAGPLDLLVSSFIDLGPNPATREIQRDFAKIASICLKARRSTVVAGTEFKFDRSHLYAQLAKTSARVVLIVGLSGMGICSATTAATLPNLPGDTLSRAFIKSGMEHQLVQDSCRSQSPSVTRLVPNLEDHLVEKLPELGRLFVEAAQEVAPKVALIAGVSQIIARTGMEHRIVSFVFMIPRFLLRAPMSPINSMRINTALLARDSGFRFYTAAPIAMFTSISAVLIKTWATVLILSTVSKFSIDSMSMYLGLHPQKSACKYEGFEEASDDSDEL